MLVIFKLLLCDFASLVHGAVLSHVLQGQVIRPGFHDAAGHDNARDVQLSDSHQVPRKPLVAACDEHAAVKGRRTPVDLDHLADDVPGNQGVIDPVMALCHAVADVRDEISRALSVLLCNSLARFLHKLQKMGAAGMAVAKGALNQDAGL